MPLYTAGQKIRASELNALPQTYFMASDLNSTVAYTTAYVNATGLSFAADANAKYLAELTIYYMAPTARDIIVAWTVPVGTTGWFGANGIDSGSGAGGVGSDNRQALDPATGVHAFGGSDGITLNATPHAYLSIGANAGTVQFKFAQLSAGSTTTLRAGSCMRVTRLL